MSNYSFLQYPKNPKVGPHWCAKGDTLEIFHQLCRTSGPFGEIFFEKKSLNAEKTERWGSFSLPWYCVTRDKMKNLFGSVPRAYRYNFVVP